NVDFRQIQAAKCDLIGIVGGLRALFGGAQHLDGPSVFSAQKVEIGNVVVGIGNQDRHALLFAVPTSLAVHLQRLRELVQVHVAEGKIAHDGRQSFGIVERNQLVVSALVTNQRVGEAVLAVIDVADVDIEAGEPQAVTLPGEELTRAISGAKRAI